MTILLRQNLMSAKRWPNLLAADTNRDINDLVQRGILARDAAGGRSRCCALTDPVGKTALRSMIAWDSDKVPGTVGVACSRGIARQQDGLKDRNELIHPCNETRVVIGPDTT